MTDEVETVCEQTDAKPFKLEMPSDRSDRISLLRKINKAHGDVLKADWEKDKIYATGSNRPGFMYLSSDKLKQNMSPILQRNGLVFEMETSNLTVRPPIGNMTTHWTIDYTGILYDIDTGACLRGTVGGEGADSGDKALSKAITSGNKLFWFNLFQIADGIDPDASPAERVAVEPQNKFNGSNTIAPPAPKTAPAPASVPASKPAVPSASVPKASVPSASVPASAVPKATVKTEPAPAERQVIPMALGNAVAKIVEARPELKDEAEKIKTIAEAQDFVAKY